LPQHLVDGEVSAKIARSNAATRTPFSAFSGTPLAAIGEQGAKAAQMSTGGQNSQRPIIVLKLVG
jgi:hypothetical protein